jgi:ubiquinone/menaquinone biosynthesis C-methylase UbiE
LSDLNITLPYGHADRLPATIAERTRRVYDLLAGVYPVSTLLFHSAAHRCVVEATGIRNGARLLEIATGSGEMFRRLVALNPKGATFGLDLSPNMASRTQKRARREFPRASAHCQAVDVRHMPFRDHCFDAVVCCYLLELLSAGDIALTLREIRRVLSDSGTLSVTLIGQGRDYFNFLYKICGRLVPAFWGRQVEREIPALLQVGGFEIESDRLLTQNLYPSRVLVARKRARE